MPLFLQLASPQQAGLVAQVLHQKFLQKGGLLTTLTTSGQQWDAPNGWAPLQWLAYQGLLNYGHDALAECIRKHWTTNLLAAFDRSGKFTEKYNVVQPHGAEAASGEYPNQDGFGWTNGVLYAMLQGF